MSERLRELGWVYGRDLVVEQRSYAAQLERVPDLAAESIRTGVDIFVVEGFSEAARVQQVTHTIPIVTLRAGDIVKVGLAAFLAKPGGNVTGVQILQADLAGKHLSLLKEAIKRWVTAPSSCEVRDVGVAAQHEVYLLTRVDVRQHTARRSHLVDFTSAAQSSTMVSASAEATI